MLRTKQKHNGTNDGSNGEPTNLVCSDMEHVEDESADKSPQNTHYKIPDQPETRPFIISPVIQPASMPMMRNRIMFIEVKREKKETEREVIGTFLHMSRRHLGTHHYTLICTLWIFIFNHGEDLEERNDPKDSKEGSESGRCRYILAHISIPLSPSLWSFFRSNRNTHWLRSLFPVCLTPFRGPL